MVSSPRCFPIQAPPPSLASYGQSILRVYGVTEVVAKEAFQLTTISPLSSLDWSVETTISEKIKTNRFTNDPSFILHSSIHERNTVTGIHPLQDEDGSGYEGAMRITLLCILWVVVISDRYSSCCDSNYFIKHILPKKRYLRFQHRAFCKELVQRRGRVCITITVTVGPFVAVK